MDYGNQFRAAIEWAMKSDAPSPTGIEHDLDELPTARELIKCLGKHEHNYESIFAKASIDEVSELTQIIGNPLAVEYERHLDAASQLPDFAADLVFGKLPWEAGSPNTEYMKAVDNTMTWVANVIQHAHASRSLRNSIRLVLGSRRIKWNLRGGFAAFQMACARPLASMGERLHKTQFVAKQLGEMLGNYVPRMHAKYGQFGSEARQFVPDACLQQFSSFAARAADNTARPSGEVSSGSRLLAVRCCRATQRSAHDVTCTHCAD